MKFDAADALNSSHFVQYGKEIRQTAKTNNLICSFIRSGSGLFDETRKYSARVFHQSKTVKWLDNNKWNDSKKKLYSQIRRNKIK